jgi:glycosyltransferase involved in cell wall biosynthesis
VSSAVNTIHARMTDRSSTSPRADRVRVVTLVDYLSLQGGAERFALQVAIGLDRERFESIMCVSRWPLPADEEHLIPSGPDARAQLERAGVRFLPLQRRFKVDPAAWMRLERFLRRERVDVLHTHKFGSNVWGTLVGKAARVPVVIAHEHTWSYEGQPLRRLVDRELIARGADAFVAVSREDQRRMTEIEGIDPARTRFVPIGILPSARPTGSDIRAELEIGPSAPVVGIVAILRPQKAHRVLLEAIAQLTGDWPDIRLLVVGDGPERTTLEGLIVDLRLQDHVRMLGLRSDVPEILRAIDVAACSSDFEGSPLAVLEYMDAALPIVATAVGGVPDLIESGVHGLLVPPGDPSALASALGVLLRDRRRAREMGERARERRRAEFDLGVVIGRLEDLYGELLAQRGRQLPRGAGPTGLSVF